MIFRYQREFLKRFDRGSRAERELVIEAERQVRSYYTGEPMPFGLRIKKLHTAGRAKVFEARVNDKLRWLWVSSPGLTVFSFMGNHGEVRRYLKRL